jgi:hypothetical protein
MPALFWAGIPVLALLWSQVIWGLVHYGSGRVAPWWAGSTRISDRRYAIFMAGLTGFITFGLATAQSMPWHARPGQLLEQGSWTWALADLGAAAVPACAAWLFTRSRR